MFIKLFTLFPCGDSCLVSNAGVFVSEQKRKKKEKVREREDCVFMKMFCTL